MTNLNSSEIGYRGPYLERPGESSRRFAEILVAPPEYQLDETEREEVYQFEHQLYAQEISEGLSIEKIIREHRSEDTTAPLVFAQAFVEDRVDVSSLPEALRPGSFGASEDVYKWFTWLTTHPEANKTDLLAIAKQSGEAYREKLADALQAGDEGELKANDMMSIILNPESALDVARHTSDLRAFLLDQRKLYSHQDGKVEGAKRAVLDVYLSKVNALSAADAITMSKLTTQAELLGDMELAERARDATSPVLTQALDSDTLTQQSTLRRLNYIQDGMGLDEAGKANAVSEKLLNSASAGEVITGDHAVFTPEQVKKLKQEKLHPEQMKVIFENILRRAGLLSSEDSSTWSENRTKRAADELFQVIENPGKSSFAVNGKDGTYRYSTKPSSLYDTLAVGGFHELTHINQVQADKQLGKRLRIAELKGKRVSMFREGGANAQQRKAERELFGSSKPIALTYAKAYNALHETGSVYAAAQAFYEEKLHAFQGIDPEKAAKEASDRVLRLKRSGGYGSGALSYAEEALLNDELVDAPEDIVNRATAVTSFDLVDQVRLHRYGLLPVSSEETIDWTRLVIEEMQPYVDDALLN